MRPSKFTVIAAVSATLVATSAGPAHAAYTTVTYGGSVSALTIPAEAPGIHLGDKVTFSATFDPATLKPIGATFFNIDQQTGLPVAVPNLRAASLSDDPGAHYEITIGTAYTFTQKTDYSVGEDYGLGAGNFPLVVYNGNQLLGLDGGSTAANGLQLDFDPLAYLLHYRSTVGLGFGNEAATHSSFRVTTDLDGAIGAAAVSAVPEPATWAALLGGMIVLGVVGRRRATRTRHPAGFSGRGRPAPGV